MLSLYTYRYTPVARAMDSYTFFLFFFFKKNILVSEKPNAVMVYLSVLFLFYIPSCCIPKGATTPVYRINERRLRLLTTLPAKASFPSLCHPRFFFLSLSYPGMRLDCTRSA